MALPFGDDFAFIARITGDEPLTVGWLYETHNEHRMVLPKLLLVFMTRVAGIDFRAVPF